MSVISWDYISLWIAISNILDTISKHGLVHDCSAIINSALWGATYWQATGGKIMVVSS